MINKPNYTVFAGINGAGKSTMYEDLDKEKLGVRINPDEIAKQLGDFNNPQIQIKAGKVAIIKIRECIDNKLDFNQETTLTGKSILRQMKQLKNEGYKINLNYIGLESKELAHERVKQRVSEGGHNIPEQTIYKRYQESINNLTEAMKLSDDIKVYDNSGEYKRNLVTVEENQIIYKSPNIPQWFKEPLEKYQSKDQELIKHKEITNIKDKIIDTYSKELPSIKHISEKVANFIDNLNSSKGHIHTIKEIKELHNNLGKKLEYNSNSEELKEFKNLNEVVDEFKQAQLKLKQEQAHEKAMTNQLSKANNLEL